MQNLRRFSASASLFLIDRSNEQVYIPDDGSLELRGPSRACGFEARASAQLTRHLSFDGGVTRVMNAFYRGTAATQRVYLDVASHTVASAGLTFTGVRRLTASLTQRHVSSYRLDGVDARVRATGLDVLDFHMKKSIGRRADLNLSLDNLTNKRYHETQNYFESRPRPGDAPASRIHGTPGYPFSLTVGITFRLLDNG